MIQDPRSASVRSAALRAIVLILANTAAGGCAGGPAEGDPAPGAGEALVRALFEDALTRGDSTMLDTLVAAELTFHASGRSATIPRQQLWALTTPIRTGFPDVRFTVDDVVEDASRVAARISFVGTHGGEWSGIAPTGRQVRVTEMFMCRVEDGLLAECWQEWDEHGLRRQLTAE